MYVEPTMISWLLILGASLCAFMIGREWSRRNNEATIEEAINYLCDEGFIKHKVLPDGQVEIIRFDEK